MGEDSLHWNTRIRFEELRRPKKITIKLEIQADCWVSPVFYVISICLRSLHEVDLEELLEVEVGDLGLVIHAEELGERGVGEDAALEVGVKARVGLDVVGDELGHLGLGALLRGLDAHEGGKLGGDGLLLEEGVVGAASLPGNTLLGGQGRGIDLALLLGVTGLLLGGLGSLLGGAHGIAHTAGELGGEGLELLRQGREESIRGLGGAGRGSGDNGDDDLGLGDHDLLGGLGGLGGGCRGRGGRSRGGDGLGGLLVGGHLVCLGDRRSRGHF
jgi:hypothetical protein